MSNNKSIFASLTGGNNKDIPLGQEPVNPATGLTGDEKKKSIFKGLTGNIGTTVTQGKIPKAYSRILGEQGYHPEFGYTRTQEILAEQQSGFGQFVNAMNQAIVGEIVGGTIEGIGYLGKVLDIGSMIDGTEQEWGNVLSDIGRELKTWTRETSPVFRDPNAKQFAPGDWSWWM